jgi:hypothetical protein
MMFRARYSLLFFSLLCLGLLPLLAHHQNWGPDISPIEVEHFETDCGASVRISNYYYPDYTESPDIIITSGEYLDAHMQDVFNLGGNVTVSIDWGDGSSTLPYYSFSADKPWEMHIEPQFHQYTFAYVGNVDIRISIYLDEPPLNDYDLTGIGGNHDWLYDEITTIFISSYPPCYEEFEPVDEWPVDTSSDSDRDGIPDISDNCEDTSNSDQSDTDADGIGDACDDTADNYDPDNDGILSIGEKADNCPSVANPDQSDSDADYLGDACDVCPLDFDVVSWSVNQFTGQIEATVPDSDGDTIPDACDMN